MRQKKVKAIATGETVKGKIVLPGCNGTVGRWFCVTHDEMFPNQFAKDAHIFEGEHTLAWICLEHGFEVP